MRVLLTGGNGFVGTYVAYALEKAGYDVVPVIGSDAKNSLDIRDATSLCRMMEEKCPIDSILHLAAQSSVHHSWEHPKNTMDINTLGTLNLWECAEKLRIPHFIYVSSAEVYAPPSDERRLCEDDGLEPSNPYGLSKLAAEKLLQMLEARSKMRLTILRPFNIIGRHQDEKFVVPNFVSQLRALKLIQDPEIHVGNLMAVRDFLDVRDVADLYVRVVASPSVTGVFNVCGGMPRSIRSVLDDLISIIHVKDLKVVVDESRKRAQEASFLVGNPEKTQRVYQWTPRIPWNDTLAYICQLQGK